MGTSVENLLTSFDRLGASEQREFLGELLKRIQDMDWPPVDDETLARLADELFLDYDAREAADGQR